MKSDVVLIETIYQYATHYKSFSDFQSANEGAHSKVLEYRSDVLEPAFRAIKFSYYEYKFCSAVEPAINTQQFDRIMGNFELDGELITNVCAVHAREMLRWPIRECGLNRGCIAKQLEPKWKVWELGVPRLTFGKNLSRRYLDEVQFELGKRLEDIQRSENRKDDLDIYGEKSDEEFLAHQRGLSYRDWKPRPPFSDFLTQFSPLTIEVHKLMDDWFEHPVLEYAYDRCFYSGDFNSHRGYALMKEAVRNTKFQSAEQVAIEVMFRIAEKDSESWTAAIWYKHVLKIQKILVSRGVSGRALRDVVKLREKILQNAAEHAVPHAIEKQFLSDRRVLARTGKVPKVLPDGI